MIIQVYSFRALSDKTLSVLATELTKSLTVLEAIYWIDSSWKATSPETIFKCFREASI